MTRVKICGITNVEDALAAVKYGADALGFICVQESPRYIDFEAAFAVMSSLPPFVATVAVVSRCEEAAMDRELYSFTAVQYYAGDCTRTITGSTAAIRACRVCDERSLDILAEQIRGVEPDALLLDTFHPDRLGGSGETFDWDLALLAKEKFGLPIILAGGLTPENAGEAVRRVRPYAVDVSSGVEASPGKKDHDKMRRFIAAVRSADEGE
jgi:phosphoribosylanthranilate isomerase